MMMRLVSLQFDQECCSTPLLVQSTSSLQCRSKEPMSQMSNLQPIFSISLIGAVCAGTMRTPKSLTVTSIAAWQQAFFQSEFTHPGGAGRLTKRHGGTTTLWKSLAGKKRFPISTLIELEPLDQYLKRLEDARR
jgi:PRTRC genetic system protein B